MATTSVNLLHEIYRSQKQRRGLSFFGDGPESELQLRRRGKAGVEIYCAHRQAWRRATPDEVLRQVVLQWISSKLGYPPARIRLDWQPSASTGCEDGHAQVAIFNDDACADPFILFELRQRTSTEGLERLRTLQAAAGCPFGCWSDGDAAVFLMREEEAGPGRGRASFREVRRLPGHEEDLDSVQQPITFSELRPIQDMRSLVLRMEHDVLANAGVHAFDEIFKLIVTKLHDELCMHRDHQARAAFRVPVAAPAVIHQRFETLFHAARRRPGWGGIFGEDQRLRLRGDALKLCASALEPVSLLKTDLDVADAAFEYLVNPEQKERKGQYFTPRPVVKMAVEMLNTRAGERLIDPACGSAGFLLHALRHLQRENGWKARKVPAGVADRIFGVDFDHRPLKVAMAMLLMAGVEKPNLFCVNALDPIAWQNSEAASRIGPFTREHRDGSFDIVLTNPPFAGKLTGATKLQPYELFDLAVNGHLPTIEESTAVQPARPRKPQRQGIGLKRDVLFLERCLNLLRPGGRMAIVLPQGNLNNFGTRGIREWLIRRARILAVVGLHVNTFKPFTGTKTSVLFLQKWNRDAGEPLADYPIFLATSQKPGKDNAGRYIYRDRSVENHARRNGTSVIDPDPSPAIDHDLDEIAVAFKEWGCKHKLDFWG